jgi:tetratricopeptide (TPR) repeat protein
MTANRIIQHIFQEPDIKQVDEAALEQLVTSYPYFTTARLLLAKKQYTVQRNLLAPAVKTAQLYSTNMHYFYRFITSDEAKAVVAPEVPVVPEPIKPVEPEQPATYVPLLDDYPGLTPEKEEFITISDKEIVVDEPVVPEPVNVEPATLYVAPEPVKEVPEPSYVTPAPEIKYETPETVYKAPEPEVEVTPSPITVIKPMADTTVNTGIEDDEIKIFPLEMGPAEKTLTYQPLYTDDYFAYKRLKEPEQAEVISEKGASEMKSFTSWLKDIKHTFSEKATKEQYHKELKRSYEDFDPEVSEAVEKMAMESITLTDDVVSETLAEIWAKQRQYQTAIHIYQKLSLLNPNKSAYFAQKIKELQLLTDNN